MDMGPILCALHCKAPHLIHVPFLQTGGNISSPKVVGKMEFDFYRWDMFPAVSIWKALRRNSTSLLVICAPPTLQRDWR